jgi:hypothetical protein
LRNVRMWFQGIQVGRHAVDSGWQIGSGFG